MNSGAIIGNLAVLRNDKTVDTNAVLTRGIAIFNSVRRACIGGISGPTVALGNDVTVLDDARVARNATIGIGVTIGVNARIGGDAEVSGATTVEDGGLISRDDVYDDASVGTFSGGTLLSSSEMD
jgi:carbonic anhydrase/acetyltransferase-like protein (isoleucine patch superfamily)